MNFFFSRLMSFLNLKQIDFPIKLFQSVDLKKSNSSFKKVNLQI